MMRNVGVVLCLALGWMGALIGVAGAATLEPDQARRFSFDVGASDFFLRRIELRFDAIDPLGAGDTLVMKIGLSPGGAELGQETFTPPPPDPFFPDPIELFEVSVIPTPFPFQLATGTTQVFLEAHVTTGSIEALVATATYAATGEQGAAENDVIGSLLPVPLPATGGMLLAGLLLLGAARARRG